MVCWRLSVGSIWSQWHHDHLPALVVKTQRGDLINDADGVETVTEGLDEKASAQEDQCFRAFRFDVGNRDSCPGLVAVVFAEEQKLPLFTFQADGLEFLRIVTRHALDELGKRFQFCLV